MSNKKDSFEEMIKDEFEKEAADIEKVLDESGIEHISDSLKDSIRANLYEQIAEYENKKIYVQLSEEDRKALELGKEMIRKQGEEKAEKTIVRKKKRPRMYLVLAAVLVLAMALGMTSIGGADRIISIVKSVVGEREVVKVNSEEDNLAIRQEDEEKAYQEIKEVFDIYPVRFQDIPDDMIFQRMEIDKNLQIAEIFYKFNEENIVFIINASYANASWGIDVEDEVIDQYVLKKNSVAIEVKEYQIAESKEKRYSASFSYRGLEYFLMGAVDKENFDEILNSLYFSRK
ncbi:MAG: DUF4367 domain-containing protein [Dorea sp.]